MGRSRPTSPTCTRSGVAGPDPTNPGHAYAEVRRFMETFCIAKGAESGFEVKIGRAFAFVGPYMPLGCLYAICHFMEDALRGRPIVISSDGTPVRSYLYAADLAIWLWTILLRGESGRPYNVGSDIPTTVRQAAESVADAVEHRPSIKVRGLSETGMSGHTYIPSVGRANSELGVQQWIPLADAIRRTIEWHRSVGFR